MTIYDTARKLFYADAYKTNSAFNQKPYENQLMDCFAGVREGRQFCVPVQHMPENSPSRPRKGLREQFNRPIEFYLKPDGIYNYNYSYLDKNNQRLGIVAGQCHPVEPYNCINIRNGQLDLEIDRSPLDNTYCRERHMR